MQSRHRSFESGVEARSALNSPDPAAQRGCKEINALDINIVSGTCYDMINHQLALSSVFSATQSECHSAACLASFSDRGPTMNREPILNPIAKPPSTFG